MAGKTWRPQDAKRFAREVKLGAEYWVIYNVAQNMATYEDAQLCSKFVFTRHAPFTGTPMTDGGETAVGLCQRHGPVYDQKPAGIRDVAQAGPQVRAPLGDNYEGFLDEAELRGLDKRVAQSSNPTNRRNPRNWRP
ncbi:hypothetical protein ACWERY_02150 [Streptomyces sp. NPDC004082]